MKLLQELKAAGFTVTTDGVNLNISGPFMTDELRERIRQQKVELIAMVADTIPERADLLRVCTEACNGLNVNAAELADWLIEQGDPGWCVPAAVRRWAEIVHQRGGYPQ